MTTFTIKMINPLKRKNKGNKNTYKLRINQWPNKNLLTLSLVRCQKIWTLKTR
jgi:hypothetical protein